MIARLLASLRGLLRRRRIDGEIAEELRDHLEREIEAHRLRGVSPEEARRLALRDLGGLTQTIESTRAVRAIWLDTAWRDLSYGARLLRRSPRFTVTALTVLVLGIGSTTAIFSIAYAVLVRPLPYADPERLVFLAEHQGPASRGRTSRTGASAPRRSTASRAHWPTWSSSRAANSRGGSTREA